ncbi:GNAT family N-acetyltransferase [Pseudooceanicola sp.]|uniref:GNAT family N-acetyltransferase n=1 Tax=Pseudooceanicola sp. TaxID=1914328 RepID=UPI00261D089C|nr:GNAT family N-acetyltransferase [Pseudooceanicola sp.]MDF1855174.1 GNAT family N-acetyltransferase [Pseudooceanicola sp.]
MIEEIAPGSYDAEIDGLTSLLHACVHAGASVNFVLPFPPEEARAFWTGKVAVAMAAGKRRLWLARAAGQVAGCVMLDWDLPPNQAHRGEVTKLLVHPDFRRRHLGQDLIATLLAAAAAQGLRLVTLDTTTGSPAQGLYAAAGFNLAGSIPNFSRHPSEDRLESTSYMYRVL